MTRHKFGVAVGALAVIAATRTTSAMASNCLQQTVCRQSQQNPWLARKPLKRQHKRYKQSLPNRVPDWQVTGHHSPVLVQSAQHDNDHTAQLREEPENTLELFPKDLQYR